MADHSIAGHKYVYFTKGSGYRASGFRMLTIFNFLISILNGVKKQLCVEIVGIVVG
jgi:hypothetical protein